MRPSYVKACTGCGTTIAPIRDDGECFRCHVRGIGFTFSGGAIQGRSGWNTTKREFLEEHVGDRLHDGSVERVS